MEALTARMDEAEKKISDKESKCWRINKWRKWEINNYWIMRGEFER